MKNRINIFTFERFFKELILFQVFTPAIILFFLIFLFVEDKVPVALTITFIFFFLAASMQHAKFNSCSKKHEKLIDEYGDEYLNLLDKELSQIGFTALFERYWSGLEPK